MIQRQTRGSGAAAARLARPSRFALVLALAAVPTLAAAQTAVATEAAAQPAPTAAQRLNTTGRVIDLVVPMRERVPLGQVAIRIAPDDQVSASVGDVANALSRTATADFITALQAIPAPDGYLPLAAFRQAGLGLEFNAATLELVANLDIYSRPTRSLSLGYAQSEQPVLPDRSAPFAIFAAVRAALDFVHEGPETGLQSPRVDVELNGRALGIAFENELTYDGDAENRFGRFGSRLIYDRPDLDIRFAAGDLLGNPVSFQETSEILGISASRLLNTFRSDRIATASAGRTVELREAATVTVVVNGVPTRTVRLDSGIYDLSDLPLTSGANAVQLVIEDQAGGRRVLSFDFFQDFDLLAPGVSEFDVQLGVRSEYFDNLRRYDTGDPAISGFYRRGLTPQLTAGANLQATKNAQQFGVEGILGTSLGLFSLEAAVSNVDGVGFGHALRLQYRFSTPLQQLQGARRVDVQVEHRSRDFGGIDSLLPFNSTSWRLSARYSQPITEVIDAGLGIDYTGVREDEDRYGLRGTLSWQIARNASLNSFAGYDNREGVNAGVSVVVRLGRTSTVSAQYDTISDQASLTYTHSPERLLDSLAFAAQIVRTPDDMGFNGTAVYRTNRGDLEVSHRAAYSSDAEEITSQITSLRYQGTAAFAGGKFALGRYVFDSFAIVSAHDSLDGAQVLIGNRLTDQVEARTGTFGPALVPLSSYSSRNIFYQVPDAPSGYDLGAGNFEVYPWLHSGFDLVVGSEFNITIIGTLLDEEGAPVPLVSGVARRVGDANSPAVSIFTNRAGRLGASGLAPGTWEITAAGATYRFTVADDQGTFINLQTLRPTGRGETRQ